MNKQTGALTKAMKGVTDSVQRFGDRLKSLSAIDIAGIANIADQVGSAFTGTAQSGMAFGQAMANLSSIIGITGNSLEDLENSAREVGRTSGLGADTAARAYATLASQIDVATIGMDGLKTLQQQSVTLAQASGMALDEAAVALSSTINQFGLSADQASRVANVLAAGSKFGAAEISELSQSFKVTGSAANALGMSVEETAGALEVLSKAGLKGSEAGTALRNIILKLNTTLGVDLSQTSLGTALDSLKPKLNDAAYLSQVFGTENVAAAISMIQNAAAIDEMTAKVTDTTVAQEQAATRTATTAQQMAEMRAKVDDLKISITNAVGSATPWIVLLTENAGLFSLITTVTPKLVNGFGTLISALSVSNIKMVAHNAAMIAHKAAALASAAASKTMSIAQAALNAVMSANPIAIVVLALAALVSGIIYAYRNFDGFREICDKVWVAVKNVANIVWNALVKAFDAVSGAIKKAWQWLKTFLGIQSDNAPLNDETQAIEEQTQAINDQATALTALTTAKQANGLVLVDGFTPKNTKNTTTSTPSEATTPQYDPLTAPLDTLDDIAARINYLRELQQTASLENVAAINDEIREYEELQSAIENLTLTATQADITPTFDPTAPLRSLNDINAALTHYNNLRLAATQTEIQGIDAQIAKLQQLRDNWGYVAQASTTAATEQATQGNITNTVLGQTAALMQNLSGVVGESAGSWLQWGANILQAVAAALPVIAQLIGGNIAQAFAGAAAQSQSVPFPYNLISLAASMAAVGAAVASIPKFADGGIAFGPTFGLFGEYAGARTNPEVVAPLSRLKAMIAPATTAPTTSGNVTFRIEGRTLVGILERQTQHTARATR